ncbi:MAG: hypothetical protein ACYC9R_06410 [Nitrosotalea sp.]
MSNTTVTRGGKTVVDKSRLIARTMTAGTVVATLPKGSRLLALMLSGTASDAGTTATVSVGTTSAANELVNAVSVLSDGVGAGVNLLAMGQSGISKLTASLSPVAVAANTTAEQLFTVPGILVGDFINVNKPTAQAGLGIVGVRASAANQVGITFSNNTAASITPTAAEIYVFSVTRAGSGNAPASFASVLTSDTQIFVLYAETGTASSVGAWTLHILYTTGNVDNNDTI